MSTQGEQILAEALKLPPLERARAYRKSSVPVLSSIPVIPLMPYGLKKSKTGLMRLNGVK